MLLINNILLNFFLQHLSSSVELISHQPSPFTNLKSLKIYPKRVDERDLPKKRVDMSVEVKKYLLDGSPSAAFTIVSREVFTSTSIFLSVMHDTCCSRL